jgi:hypothetical protein
MTLQAAVAHLRGESPRLVSGAARILGARGSGRAKGPLLDRLARWNEEWVGRESELVNALLDGREFSLTTEETERVRGPCLTRACRDSVDARARSRPAR